MERRSIEPAPIQVVDKGSTWMDGILAYLKDGTLPHGYAESTTMKKRANGFVLVKGELFKRAFKKPLLKCVTPKRGKEILDDLH